MTTSALPQVEQVGKASYWLAMGLRAARDGQPHRARRYLGWAVVADRACTEAWLWLAWLSTDPAEQSAHLRQVLALQPDHPQAQAELAKLASIRSRGQSAGRLLGWVGLVLLALAALFATSLIGEATPVASSAPPVIPSPTLKPAEALAPLVPEMEAALAAADWGHATEVLDTMYRLDPAGRQADRWTFAFHQRQAEVLIEANQLPLALEALDRAIAARPMEASAYLRRQIVAGYLAGQARVAAGDWTAAIEALELVYAEVPDFKDTGSLLAQAHLATGTGYQEAAEWQLARKEFERVLELVPGHAEAQDRLAFVMRKLYPPQKVIVDVSEQRMYVYENDVLIWNWPASTGEPGRGTAVGNWRILDKIPMAYASTWSLQMPYWMGIYWVGSIENGIHGPPINRYGQVMWEGYIGRPVSYGCIILSSANVRTLYNWVEIGTPVIVRP